MKLIAGQEKGLTVFLHLNWHTCNRANPFQGFSAVSPYNRRIRDPYVRWCERRTPSVSGGAVYSIGQSCLFLTSEGNILLIVPFQSIVKMFRHKIWPILLQYIE